jgi:hypothetical protein
MRARFVASFLLVAGTSLGAQESKLWYTPGSAQYKVTTSTNTTQEMNGQKQEFTASAEQKVSVTIGGGKKDSLALTIVLDSIVQQVSVPGAPDVSKMIGMTLQGTMSTQGKVYESSVKMADGTDAVSQQGEGMRRFLPRLPAMIKTGNTWTDTISGRIPAANGAEMNRSAIVTYTVLGDTTIAGQKSWKIGMESKAKITGKGNQQGADFTIDGGANGAGVTYVAPNGWFVGMDATENQELTVTVEAAGMVIPIVSATKTKVERLK